MWHGSFYKNSKTTFVHVRGEGYVVPGNLRFSTHPYHHGNFYLFQGAMAKDITQLEQDFLECYNQTNEWWMELRSWMIMVAIRFKGQIIWNVESRQEEVLLRFYRNLKWERTWQENDWIQRDFRTTCVLHLQAPHGCLCLYPPQLILQFLPVYMFILLTIFITGKCFGYASKDVATFEFYSLATRYRAESGMRHLVQVLFVGGIQHRYGWVLEKDRRCF